MTFGLAFLAFVFSSSSGGRASAAGSGNTGAPGESTTCVTCHGGGNFNVGLSINIYNQGTITPITTYSPGQTYSMEVTISNSGLPGGFGFQMVALNASNSNAGSWLSPSSNTQIATLGNGRSYAEHNGISGTNTFMVDWTAPTTGTGSVTFYSAGNAVNGTGSTAGDGAATSSLMITEMVANVSADMATNISLADNGNNGNGSDLQFSFDAAANENTVSQYRVIIVKQSNAASFNLATAQGLINSSYTTVNPNGSATYTQSVGFLTKDSDGANIVNGQSYVAFVLSAADGTNANLNVLSSVSSSVLMQGVAGTATGLMASDTGSPGAPDLNVMFNKATDESTVSEYRVMLVENSNMAAFDLAAAQSVMMANYVSVSPNGSANYTASFGMASNDASGSPLSNGTTYAAFVLSIADGTLAVTNTLSTSSNTLLLQTVAGVATNVMALDTNETATGEDLLVYFDAATDESTISEYRILVVKSANANGFTEPTASAVVMSNYTTVTTSGNMDYSTTLANTATDVDGDAIAVNMAYKVFVLSVANGTTAGTSTLSTGSAEVTLNDPVSTLNQLKLSGNATMIGEQLYLTIDNKFLNKAIQLSIIDANGRLVIQQNINDSENWIDMNAYAKGIYWINLRSENQTWTKAVLK